jgi:predicted ArsR family transcriptional regulator
MTGPQPSGAALGMGDPNYRTVRDAALRAKQPADGRPAGSHAAHLRQAILHDLRRNGLTGPDELSRRVGASRTGVLQQLRALEVAGLVKRQTVRHGVGRPRHVFDITPAAQGLFPSNYDGLATDMLAAVAAVGGESLVTEVFAARRKALRERVTGRLAARLPAGAPLFDRVRELAVVQDEQGYLCHASIEPDGASFRLSEHNCAIYQVALGHPSACKAEEELFREVLQADVVRESHIAAGDRCCSYRITESSSPSTR